MADLIADLAVVADRQGPEAVIAVVVEFPFGEDATERTALATARSLGAGVQLGHPEIILVGVEEGQHGEAIVVADHRAGVEVFAEAAVNGEDAAAVLFLVPVAGEEPAVAIFRVPGGEGEEDRVFLAFFVEDGADGETFGIFVEEGPEDGETGAVAIGDGEGVAATAIEVELALAAGSEGFFLEGPAGGTAQAFRRSATAGASGDQGGEDEAAEGLVHGVFSGLVGQDCFLKSKSRRAGESTNRRCLRSSSIKPMLEGIDAAHLLDRWRPAGRVPRSPGSAVRRLQSTTVDSHRLKSIDVDVLLPSVV